MQVKLSSLLKLLRLSKFLIIIFCILLTTKAKAASFEVSNTNDSGAGSLRQAILDAHLSSGPHIITFSVSGLLMLDSELPIITEQVNIQGQTAPGYTVGNPTFRIALTIYASCFRLNNSNGSVVNGLDLSAIAPISGIGVEIYGGSVTVSNCKIRSQSVAIELLNAINPVIMHNDFTDSETQILINNLQSIAIGSINNNIWGGDTKNALTIMNTAINVTVGDASVTNAHIVINDNSFLNSPFYQTDILFGANNSGIAVYDCSGGITIDNIDLSKAGTSIGIAIYLKNNNNARILNCQLKNRKYAVVALFSNNPIIQGNDFTNSVTQLNLLGVTNLGIGAVTNNSWGGSNTGTLLRLDSISTFVLIGDESVPNAHIVIPDSINLGSSLYFVGSLHISGCSAGIELNNLNLSALTGYMNNRQAIDIYTSRDVVILDCDVQGNNLGIRISKSNIIMMQGNNMYNCKAQLEISNSTMAIGAVTGNIWGGQQTSFGLMLIDITQNLTVGDASVSDAHIVIPDSSFVESKLNGDENLGESGVFVAGCPGVITIDNVDFSHNALSKPGTGIFYSRSNNVNIRNCRFENREFGIEVSPSINLASNISCNSFENNSVGISIGAGNTGFVMKNNSFLSNTFSIISPSSYIAESCYWGGGVPALGSLNGFSSTITAVSVLTSPPVCTIPVAGLFTIRGNGLYIDLNSSPKTENFTYLGSVKPSGVLDRTFTIENNQNTDLTITQMSITGTHAVNFTWSGVSLPLVLRQGEKVNFVVKFLSSALGDKRARINIMTNKGVSYMLIGASVSPTVLNILGNNQYIPKGNISAFVQNNTNFGTRDFCYPAVVTKTYQIRNDGNLPITLSGTPLVSISGNKDFTISAQPTGGNTIAQGSSKTFSISYKPEQKGEQVAIVYVKHGKQLYYFSVRANGGNMDFPSIVSLDADKKSVCEHDTITLLTNFVQGVKYNWYKNKELIKQTDEPKLQAIGGGNFSTEIVYNDSCKQKSAELNVSETKSILITADFDGTTLSINIPAGKNVVSAKWKIDGVEDKSLDNKLTFKPYRSGLYELTIAWQTDCDSKLKTNVVLSVLGIDENNSRRIIIYPNPVKDEIFINLGNEKSQNVKIVLADIFGRTLIEKTETITDQPVRLDVSALTAGTYFVTLLTDLGKKTGKIIKK